MDQAVAEAEALMAKAGEVTDADVAGLRQRLEAVGMSASLKPVLRRRLDDLGKAVAAKRKADTQVFLDRGVAAVSERE
jgi:hypothetical protein